MRDAEDESNSRRIGHHHFCWHSRIVELLRQYLGVSENPVPRQIRRLDVFGLADTPIVGPIIFNQTILTYVSWVLVVLATVYLFRTRIGLQLRAVGESPQTADAMGINVVKYRYLHTILVELLPELVVSFTAWPLFRPGSTA